MNYKYLLLLIFGILSFNVVFSAENLFTCSFDTSIGAEIITANGYFYDLDNHNLVLSSNVAISSDLNYNRTLRCNINSNTISNIQTSFQSVGSICPNDGQDLFYLTGDNNARVGFKYLNTHLFPSFDLSFYSKKLCVSLPDEFSSIDIFVSDSDKYKNAGYTCLFKISNLTNGVVSSCEADFNGNDQYVYTIWTKLYENLNSLKCNSDCTSVLDNRIYSACSQKISTCSGIPSACDGSLIDSWVSLNPNFEVKCAAPWGEVTRSNIFTTENIEIEDVDNKCLNIISKKYSVILDNELVTMDVYICGDKNE